VTIGYDRTGRPKTITDGSGSRTLSYHASGQLEDES
jgi:YD repeat-containing protein